MTEESTKAPGDATDEVGEAEEERSSAPPDQPQRTEALSALGAEGGASLSSGERERHEELMAKRREEGLSDAEAEELGRLIAAAEGRQHTSARVQREGIGEEEETAS